MKIVGNLSDFKSVNLPLLEYFNPPRRRSMEKFMRQGVNGI